jgi:hypothetical protein
MCVFFSVYFFAILMTKNMIWAFLELLHLRTKVSKCTKNYGYNALLIYNASLWLQNAWTQFLHIRSVIPSYGLKFFNI